MTSITWKKISSVQEKYFLMIDLDELKKNNNNSREPCLTCCPEETGWSTAAWYFCRGHVSVSHCTREPDPRVLGTGERPQESAQTMSDATETTPAAFRVLCFWAPSPGLSLPGLGGPGISGTTQPFLGQVSALQSQNTEERWVALLQRSTSEPLESNAK